MAKCRMVLSRLYTTPKFVKLFAEHGPMLTHILVGLNNNADDYGRGYADPLTLSNQLMVSQQDIEKILDVLEKTKFIYRYKDSEDEIIYWLCFWEEWNSSLTESKRAKSHFPSPCGKSPEIPVEKPPQVVVVGEGESKTVITSKSNVVVVGGNNDNKNSQSANSVHLADHIATALGTTTTNILMQIVEDYRARPEVSLVLEAMAARKYSETPGNNPQNLPCDDGFFKKWLEKIKPSSQSSHIPVVYRDKSRTDFDRLPPEHKAYNELSKQQSYARNQYAQDHPEEIDEEIRIAEQHLKDLAAANKK